MSEFITIQTFSNRIEAEIVKGLLESNNIRAIICADDAGGMRPAPLQYVAGVDLKVESSMYDKSKKLIKKASTKISKMK